MKKIFSIILCSLLLFSTFVFVPVSAEEKEFVLEVELNPIVDVTGIGWDTHNGFKAYINYDYNVVYYSVAVMYDMLCFGGENKAGNNVTIYPNKKVPADKQTTLDKTYVFSFIEMPNETVLQWFMANGTILTPPCDGLTCPVADLNTDGFCDLCYGALDSSIVNNYRPLEAPTYLPYFPLGFNDDSQYVIYEDSTSQVYLYAFTPISYLPVAYWGTRGHTEYEFIVESIDGNGDPIDTQVRYYKLIDGESWAFQALYQQTTTLFGNSFTDEVLYSTLTLYSPDDMQVYPPRQCDGTACNVADIDVDGRCDDCGYMLAYSVRPTYTPNNWPSELPIPPLGYDDTTDYIITSDTTGIYLYTWTPRESYSSFTWINQVKENGDIVIESSDGSSVAYMNYHKYVYDSTTGNWKSLSSSQSQYKTTIGVKGETQMIYSTLDIMDTDGSYFFPLPLWGAIQAVTKVKILGTQAELAEVLMILATIVVGGIALLMVLHLLAKKFRRFLP